MTFRSFWALTSGVAVVSATSVGSAAPGDATRLEYARSAEVADCPDRSALREAVTRRLGYDPFFPAARQAIVVEITADAHGLRGALRLLDEHGFIRGTRELRERREHCEELVASLALAVSIALDPSAAFEAEPSEPAPPSESAGAPAEAVTSPPEAVPEPVPQVAVAPLSRARRADRGGNLEPARAFWLGPRAQLFSAFGAAPGLVWGVRGGVALGRDWFALAGELAYQAPASREVETDAQARTTSWTAELAPCFRRWSWYGCAVGSAGYLTSEGEVAAGNRVTSTQVAVGARLEYAPTLSARLHLLLGIQALKPLIPLTLRLNERDVWSSPWLSVSLAAGLQLEFP